MLEEEKRAIERLKERKDFFFYNGDVIILNLISTLQKELDKKDKVIDLMAEKINDAYFEENDFYLWYEKILGVQKEENYNYMKNILKQYFYKKAEEENE